MKLVRRETSQPSTSETSGVGRRTMNRRAFLKRSGISVGGIAAASSLPLSMVQKKAHAATTVPIPGSGVKQIKTVCTHCSVGCGIYAEVQNGVWTGQEPDFESPFNLGAHCAKGASVREHGHGAKRVKYPMKLVDG
ncbi:MAG: twin-arginine translocation signal domain-containing protein, partial [Gammaproteobacteria bacterium]|nr:twin-arginine translocation signal domain-containing protein [Gammaproteobacteria bacterium]